MPSIIYDVIEESVANDLNNRFSYHAPLEGQSEKYEKIRSDAKDLAFLFERACPKSRELSLALTHLEEAVFWANAAIARNEKLGVV